VKSDQLFNVEGYGVVVTGGASGLGLGFSEALAENGARVTMLDIDAERIARESERLRALGYAVRGEVVDVQDHAGIEHAFDAAVAAHGNEPAIPKVRSKTTPMNAGSASLTSI
jgi:NAD(P)-dependent dehydrogenase (short-subunit alcohol dehydrogenase family)